MAISLKPIDEVIDALTDIEDGQLDRRLPIFGLPEMASISRKFNGMAATMQSSIRSNHRLTQQIIRLQEAERKSLAHELHDEIGQHLTAIHVDASVIRGSQDLEAAKNSATAIDSLVRQMAVSYITCCKTHTSFNGLVCIIYIMVVFVFLFYIIKNLNCFFRRCWLNKHLLESSF